MTERFRPWFEVVRLDPDVEAGRLAMATFAIDFGGVLANSEGVPLVYRDSRAFWQATQLTGGIRRRLEEVLDRLSGKAGGNQLEAAVSCKMGDSALRRRRENQIYLQRIRIQRGRFLASRGRLAYLSCMV